MFTGLSAFPLTPVTARGVDEKGFSHILSRLTEARVDSMGLLGSTGSYAYLTREQRKRVATLAKQHAGDIPMMVCVGAVSTDAILHLADDAQAAGANALLSVHAYRPTESPAVRYWISASSCRLQGCLPTQKAGDPETAWPLQQHRRHLAIYSPADEAQAHHPG